MITSLHVRNFRSILDASVDLGQLTVLVGANGSGKSNLVKALQFLARIPGSGLSSAVSMSGGLEGVIPKAIPRRDFRKTHVLFEYRTILVPPRGYPDQHPPPSVDHELELAYSADRVVRVFSEKLTFRQVLTVAWALGDDTIKQAVQDPAQSSSFRLTRGAKGAVRYQMQPSARTAVAPYAEWLGLYFFEDSLTSSGPLRRLLGKLMEEPLERHQSFIDPGCRSVVQFAAQAQAFRRTLVTVRRYDLLLDQLRREQRVSDALQLSPEGDNMPSVLSRLRDDQASWDRMLATLGAVAPHVDSLRSSSLRSGKEFVEFLENAAGRGVESWESSDGTLRALAILLALEGHPEGSTVLIEEPEQNLHPWAVRAVVEHIREVMRERGLQVILTTHSPQVVEAAEPEEVVVTTRTAEEGTQFHTLAETLPGAKIRMGEVADLWVKGLLGGVPSYA